MLRKVYWILFALTVLASAGIWGYEYQDWQRLSGIDSILDRDNAINRAFATMVPLVASAVILSIFTWFASFDKQRRSRPFIILFLNFAIAGSTIGLLTRLWMYRDISGSEPTFDTTLGLFAGGGSIATVLLFGAIELGNRVLWLSLAKRFDQSDWAGPAIFATRMSLIFKPGEEGMLRSVALARFRKGVRGDVVTTLETLYEAGVRDEDILECLCKSANEEKDSQAYLVYLRELHELLPDDQDLQEILVEALLEHKEYKEALLKIEQFGLTRDEDEKEQYARLLLAEGSLEKAATISIEIGELEGIPFRRSQALLREILARVSEYVPAFNALAAQSDRMKQKEAKVRWLEKSLEADPRQSDIRLQLIETYRLMGNSLRLETLIEEELREQPENPDLLFELASMQNDNGKVAEALATLHLILAGSRVPMKARLLTAHIYFDEEDLEKAKEIADKALLANPKESDRKELDGLLNKIEKAVLTAEVSTILDQARANPEDFPLQMEALERLISGGHADKIIGQVDAIFTHHPEQKGQVMDRLERYALEADVPFPVLNLLSDLQAAAGRYNEALEVIRIMGKRAMDEVTTIRDNAQKVLRRSPHHLPTLRLLGDTYRAHGKHTDMIHSYSLYLSQGGEETEEIDRSLANAYLSLKDYDNSKRFVRQLINNENVDLELVRRIIPLALDNDEPEDAGEYLKSLELLDPKGIETKKLKEKVDAGLGERRFSFLKRELETGKGNGTETLEQLGDIARKMANYNEAITYFQRASRDRDDAMRARRCQAKLAWCYMKKRLDDLAGDTLKDIAISLDDDPDQLKIIMDILYEIGDMFLEYRMYARAEKVFKQLCKIDAGYRDVLAKVESLRT